MSTFYNALANLYINPVPAQQASSFLETMETSLRTRQLITNRVGKKNNMQQIMQAKPPTQKPKAEQICKSGLEFTSSELSMSDKRVLMKFLRYCLDLSEDDALTLNEKSLAKGRSLKRPQNKGVDNGAYDYEKYKDQPFIAFLKNSRLF